MFGQSFIFGSIAGNQIVEFTVEFLVVGGGGGSAGMYTYDGGTGGAGAGGLRTSYGSISGGGASAESDLTLMTGTNYLVTVGAGGAATAPRTNNRTSGTGSNSVFSTITALGGGYGGGIDSSRVGQNGGSGGSGGGAGTRNYSRTGGSGTTNQGYSGGDSTGGYTGPGGGGAGESGAGNNNDNTTGAKGGNGISVTIISNLQSQSAGVGEGNGPNVWYAGGGAGSPYSSPYTPASTSYGGGGQYTSGNANAGTANTGGGAGGTARASSANGAAGGSGVVIIKYPNTRTINVGPGLTDGGLTYVNGSDYVAVFKGGSDYIYFT